MPLSVNDKKAIVWIAAIVLAANVGMFFLSTPSDKAETYAETSSSHDNNKLTGNKTNKQPFFFDPNTASYETLLSLGLRPNTAKAIVNYRKAGGVFHKPKDLARIYTLSDSDYQRLSPYIRITNTAQRHSYAETYRPQNQSSDHATTNNQQESAYTSFKLKPGQTIEINTADSTLLQRIPGIGPYYASKIIRYRNRLGGFVSVSQIKEVHGVPDDIEQWLKINKAETTKLKINKAEFKQLLRHPYFNYEQVVAIFNYRKVYGNIHNISELANYTAFSPPDFVRLTPYLDYSE